MEDTTLEDLKYNSTELVGKKMEHGMTKISNLPDFMGITEVISKLAEVVLRERPAREAL